MSNAPLAKPDDEAFPLKPGLATTYEGGDPLLLKRVAPLIDYLEVVPDCIAVSTGGKRAFNERTLSELVEVSEQASIIVHGIGLSIGSHDGYSQEYVRLLDQLLDRVNACWHSEHLGYTSVDGVNLGTMLPLPRTEEALDLVCGRVREIQQRYKLPFLLENVAHVLPEFGDDFSPAEFLNAIVERTGCHLLLDVYNLECDVHNHALDLDKFLAELNLDSVWEIHLANGVEHRGLRLDVHSNLTRQTTLDTAKEILQEAKSVRAVTYEFLSQAVPVLGHDAIVHELQRIRDQLLC